MTASTLQWIILEEAGLHRMLGQKASRIFFQIAKGVNVQQSRVDLGTTLAAASSSLRFCIEGSYDRNIPAPTDGSTKVLRAIRLLASAASLIS